jgi:16S rRNA processing protein RimM
MIRIGKIVATHGVAGAVIMTHVAGNKTWLKKGHALMIEVQKGSLIPYFVTDVRAVDDEEYVINLEDVITPQAAKKLVSRHVFADEKILSGIDKRSPLLWIGFNIADTHYGNVGELLDVMQAGVQWIGKLNYNGHEVLIPLVDAIIESVDYKTNTMKTNIPEGLFEVYEQ